MPPNISDAAGSTAFAYTPVGQLASENGPWANDTVAFTYTNRMRASLSALLPNAAAWLQSYSYDSEQRLYSTADPSGQYTYSYPTLGSARYNYLYFPNGVTNSLIFDNISRLTNTALYFGPSLLDQHGYHLDLASRRVWETRSNALYNTSGNRFDYTYDNIGQLISALGTEGISGSGAHRAHERFGYGYDKAWNLVFRTNDPGANQLVQSLTVDSINQLSSGSRSGTVTVSGLVSSDVSRTVSSVTVNGSAATLYSDGSFAKEGVSLVDGTNAFTAIAQDASTPTRKDTNSITSWLPASPGFLYDLNGNLLGDGRRRFEFDDENQLVRATVGAAAKSEFVYDGWRRKRISRDYLWGGNAATAPLVTSVSLGTQRNNYSGWVGFRFTVGNAPMIVTDLGRWVVSGNSGTHAVKLVHSDGNDISGGFVTINTSGLTAGQFAYATLTNAVALEANTTYFVVSEEVNGGDHWYDDNTGVATTNGATVTAAVYATNNSTAYSLGTGTTTNSTVPVNFKCATGAWNLARETHFVYDGRVVVQERDQNNVPQVAYSRGLDLSRSRQGAGGIGGLLARTDLTAGTSAYYHCDAGGNISEMVNANGSVVAIYRYDPFGNLTGQAGPLANANPYRFSSKEWSANAALYYYGYRFYDPELQRWLNQDPVEEAGGINLYQFVNNDPIDLFDPLGLTPPTGLQGGYVDPFGNWHASFCMSCHDGTPAANFYSAQAMAANNQSWVMFVYQQGLGLGLGLGLGGVADDIAVDGMVGLETALQDAQFAPPNVSCTTKTVTVSRWGSPGLKPQDWVMVGPKSPWNYLMSGKYQPSWFPGDNIPDPYSSGVTYNVPPSSL